jgi:hypothetical protein
MGSELNTQESSTRLSIACANSRPNNYELTVLQAGDFTNCELTLLHAAGDFTNCELTICMMHEILLTVC